MEKILPLFNSLYNVFPSVYSPLYFGYKRITDVDKIVFVKSWLRKGDATVDVGANIGFYTKNFCNLVGKTGEVHAFEPDLANFRILQRVCRKYSNVFLNKLAVSNKKESLPFYRSNKRNTDHQTFDIGEGRSFVRVPAITLDSYFGKDKNVNLIKLDIQGHDYYALLGMKEVIKRSKRIALIGEIWPYAFNKAGVDVENYLSLIRELGLTVKNTGIDAKKLSKQIRNPSYFVDFIAVKA